MKENIIKNLRKTCSKKSFFTQCLVASALLLLPSCSSILDREPLNEVDASVVVTDKSSANAAVAGLYNELQSENYYGFNFVIIGDVSADIAESIGTWDFYREMDTYQVSAAGNTENDNFYTRAYATINVANNVLKKVTALDNITEADKSPMLGAAYFVRALALFDLTRLYGGVPGVIGTMGMPILTEPTNSVPEVLFPSRPTLEASYAAVEDDLLMALDLLPETGDRSIASKGAARALLSRLYLYLKNYDNVIDYSTDVIGDAKYNLNPTFADMFENKLGMESIFELNFNSSDQSGIRGWYNPVGGRGDLTTHASFYQEATANPDDVRGKLYGYAVSNGNYQTKYKKQGGLDNIMILRLAEMYLNRAEAFAYNDDIENGIDDLNIIRIRAGIGAINPEPTTKEALITAINKERKLEFAFEGHRYFDLMRTGDILSVLQNIPRRNGPAVGLPEIGRALFPIPNFEIDANPNLMQNEAYR
jgi:hypothetical protein